MKITEQYRTIGVQEYYQDPNTQATYSNPHALFIENSLRTIFCENFTEGVTVLDLACGDGLISSILKECGVSDIEGSDKYMYERYTNETGFNCYDYSFEDIADFNCTFDKHYDVIVCSYAYDIVPESYKQKLLYALSTYTDNLILIRPNSHIVDNSIWQELQYCKIEKSRAVLYKKERHS